MAWEHRPGRRAEARHLDAVLLDASLRQVLVAVRALGRAGYAVGAVDQHGDGVVPAFASRWCASHARTADAAHDPDGSFDEILALLRAVDVDVVIPSHDGTVEALRRRRAEVERSARIALADEPALARAVDKVQTLQVAAELGIAIPRTIELSAESDVDAAVAELGLPAVVKPTRSWVEANGTGTRLVLRATADPFTARVEAARLFAAGAGVVLQELIPGPREAVSFVRAGNRFHGGFAQLTTRSLPVVGGSSVTRTSIPLPADAWWDARRLVDALGLEGYAEVEFRRDADGRPVLMEVNPRLSASVEVAVRSGVDQISLLLRWARGEKIADERAGYRVGTKLRWLGGDVAWLRETWRNQGAPQVGSRWGALAHFLEPPTRYRYDAFDREDLPPVVALVGRGAQDVARRAIRTIPRRAATPRRSPDAVVVGAGPYGLSVSAHLAARGVEHRVFGETMSTWRDHMPLGMYLRSEAFASNLSDPAGSCTLAHYLREEGLALDGSSPVPLDVFLRYADWFVDRNRLHVERSVVERVERADDGWAVELSTGEEVRAQRVVVAVGISHFARIAPAFARLSPAHCSHTSALHDLGSLAGRDVTVVGMGQSAREYAALLHECGASVRVLARRHALNWDPLPAPTPRPLLDRLRRPRAGLALGWEPWLFEHAPELFHRLPADERARLVATRFGPTGAWWLRPRIEGRVPILLNRVVRSAQPVTDGVRLDVDGPDGREIVETEHVVLATGYRVDLDRVAFLSKPLRTEIQTNGGAPSLGPGFESSAPGLQFVGMAAATSFGPSLRFLVGTRYAAREVAKVFAR